MLSYSIDLKRERAHLWTAISITLVLSAYRLSSGLFDEMQTFFAAYTELPIADVLTNVLFFWLLALLWLAYRRWRIAVIHEQELERVLTSISPDSLAVINPKRIITMCSGQVEAMFGITAKELIGKSTDVLYFDRRIRGEKGEIANRLEKFGFHVGHATGKRLNGETFPLEIITGTMKGQRGAVLLMRDITERCNTQDALRESEERFDLFMRYLPGCAFVKDADGKHIYLNTHFERVFGWSIPDVIGKTDHELFPKDMADHHIETDKRVLEQNHEIRYVSRVMQNDEPRSMLTYKFPIPSQTGGRPMLGGISLDITDQERAERERRNIEKRMQQAQKLESLGVLGGGIAHDFNNLLMGMLGHADLALMQLPQDAPARQNMEEVVVSAQRAADLANQLLAYSGEGKFVIETVSLSDLVEEMGNLLKVSISKKVILNFDLDSEIPATQCDTTQIRQVIMNLIVNASDALNNKDGRITIATGSVHRKAEDFVDAYIESELPEGDYIYIRISDTGCGMDEETKSRIFDPFFTTKFAGRGLGLAAVMGIVRGHNGAIAVDSEVGVGSTFTVYLPASDEALEQRVTKSQEGGEWRGEGVVIVADDEEMVRNVARMMLESIGFDVVMTENGLDAIEKFKASRDDCCAVLLDLTMPELGGLEAFQEIRQINADIPVILSSGYNKQDEVEHLDDSKPPLFLKKPYRVESMRATFRTALS